MKTKLTILVIAIAVLFGTSSCKEELPSMNALVDGVEWTASASVVGLKVSSTINIVGYVKNGKKITVSIIDENAPELKTYKLELGTVEAACVYFTDESDDSDKYVGSSGEVTITKIDGSRLSGTFWFTVYKGLSDKIEIKSGEFKNVPYL